MKNVILIFFLTSLALHSLAQDLIIRNNGENVNCKILKTDSLNVYFKFEFNKNIMETSVPLNSVKEIIYNMDTRNITQIPDSIHYLNKNGSYNYYHRGIKISGRQLGGLIALNSAAYKEFKDYNDGKIISNIFGFVGGFMIGWNIGKMISAEEPNWYVVGGGAGLIILSIPISLSARNSLHNAIDIYNSGLQNTTAIKKEIIFGFNNTGLGIQLKF